MTTRPTRSPELALLELRGAHVRRLSSLDLERREALNQAIDCKHLFQIGFQGVEWKSARTVAQCFVRVWMGFQEQAGDPERHARSGK